MSPRARSRLFTHAACAAFAATALPITRLLDPARPWLGVVTLGTGYAGLLFLAATLMVGPWQVLRSGRSPVNVDLRRDLGIWAAVLGITHVPLGLEMHMGGEWARYFLVRGDSGWRPLLNVFGAANDTGLLAALLLLLLLALSNDASLRRLGASRWKRLQQGSYLVAGLVAIHTVGYLWLTRRPAVVWLLVALVTTATAVLQWQGFRARRQSPRPAGS